MTNSEVKKLCKKYDVYPSKAKGQNFLLCDEVLEDILSAGTLKKDDIVLEIGPGFGFLTKRLADHANFVVSIELDDNLIKAAEEILKDKENIRFIHGDILKLADNQIKDLINENIGSEKKLSDNPRAYKIIANLPYSITGAFLKKFLSIACKPSEMILMLQKEVALRICAPPGQLSILGVSVQYYACPEIIKIVPRSCFYPAPEVDSAIVKLTIKKEFIANYINEKKFFQILKIGFSAKRKMLKNNLFNGFRGMGKSINISEIENILAECDISEKARPQNLAVKDWIKLTGKMEEWKVLQDVI